MAFGRPRPGAEALAQAAPAPATIPDAELQLAALSRQRAELAEALSQIPTREQELLSRDAPDGDFDQLDADARQYRRQLAKLDLREQELLREVREIQAAERRLRWDELTGGYSSAVEQFISAIAETERLRREVQQISDTAASAGFVFAGQGLLPPPPHPPDLSFFLEAARAAMARTPPAPAGQLQPLYSLRFTKSWDRYNCKEIAGFPARVAHQIFALGVAEWVGEPAPKPEDDTSHPPRRVLSRVLP